MREAGARKGTKITVKEELMVGEIEIGGSNQSGSRRRRDCSHS